MTVLALLAAALAVPAGSAQFMGTNAAVYAPTVVAGVASLNWAGYAETGFPSYNSVQATWTVPAATCDSGEASMSAVWVGLGGFSQNATGVEQIGTSTNCDGKGEPSYFAWYELFPLPAVMIGGVTPGETINASVVANADGSYTLTMNGQSFTVTTPAGDNTSAEWIAEAPATCTKTFSHCKPLPLTDFGSVTFANMNASPFFGPMVQITMVTKSFAIKAAPTSFDGSSFTVYRLHK
jgi:hypothetical protein